MALARSTAQAVDQAEIQAAQGEDGEYDDRLSSALGFGFATCQLGGL